MKKESGDWLWSQVQNRRKKYCKGKVLRKIEKLQIRNRLLIIFIMKNLLRKKSKIHEILPLIQVIVTNE